MNEEDILTGAIGYGANGMPTLEVLRWMEGHGWTLTRAGRHRCHNTDEHPPHICDGLPCGDWRDCESLSVRTRQTDPS